METTDVVVRGDISRTTSGYRNWSKIRIPDLRKIRQQNIFHKLSFWKRKTPLKMFQLRIAGIDNENDGFRWTINYWLQKKVICRGTFKDRNRVMMWNWSSGRRFFPFDKNEITKPVFRARSVGWNSIVGYFPPLLPTKWWNVDHPKC